ncbi:MAG: LamG domain-containing protein, partial [Planctomycetales bacterium]|nr:LamG domain-containing protein [Planctomycetales bacterium]
MRKQVRRQLAVVAATLVTMAPLAARADYSAAVLADNPLGYWSFNDGDSVVPNQGGGGTALDGQVIGGQFVSAPSFQLVDGRTVSGLGAGNRAYLVGENLDEYMAVEESILSDLGEFTLEAWVNPGVRDGNRIGLFGQNDAVEFGFISPNQIQLWTPAGQTLNYVIDPVNQIPEDTWFHMAAVANGNNIRLFINGEPTSAGASYGNGNFNFNIG